MDTLLINCSECQYEKVVDDGVIEVTLKKTGLGVKAFFSRADKDFVSLPVIVKEAAFQNANPEDFKNFDTHSLATPTTTQVVAGAGEILYEHHSSARKLVPLSYYRSGAQPKCPVCGKGSLKIENI